MGNRSRLDQFYTKRSVSLACVSRLIAILDRYDVDIHDALFVEPSAGDGSFIEALSSNGIDSIYAYDIDPKASGIMCADWLVMGPPAESSDKVLIIIGNPPFGNRSTIAKKFIEHSITWGAKFIAFILPDTFGRMTNQKCFGKYRLIDVWKLHDNDFILDGEDYHVPCSFFILTSIDGVAPGIDLRDKKVRQPADYTFLQRGDTAADFCVNGNSGRVHDVDDVTNSKAEHYIKVNDGYDVATVRGVFNALEYEQLSSCNGGNWWINRNDINKAYLSVINKAERYGSRQTGE